MPGEGENDFQENIVVATIHPQDFKEAPYILERWVDFQYVEVGREFTEEEAKRKAQEIANTKEVTIQVRLRNEWDD